MDDQKTNTDCWCYTLQSVDTKPVILVRDPVVTLGLVAALLFICLALASLIYVRKKGGRGHGSDTEVR